MKYRAEIDGLRALAVLPVILFHAGFEQLSGGYVGVDIFFVISGYLITTILINEIENKTFSFIDFYNRRARRILPALFLVMVTCILVFTPILLPDELENFGQSLIATTLVGNNILLSMTSGYWQLESEFKPLLHTWSLGVEEQYYIIFPLFLFLTWRLSSNRVFGMIVVLAVLSFLLSEWSGRYDPRANFYLLPTRAWEILIGSISAFIILKKGVQKNNIFSIIGLALIIFSIFIYDETTPFPGLYTLVPVIGASLIILFADKETIAAKALSTKAIVAIGLVSYSAYLWHQPIIVFFKVSSASSLPFEARALTVALTFIFAFLSYKFIEVPFRNKLVVKSSSFIYIMLITSSIIIGIGSLLHFSEGFARQFYGPSMYGSKTVWNNYVDTNSNDYIDPKFLEDAEENSPKTKTRLLVIGSSYGRDFSNILAEAGLLSDLSFLYVNPRKQNEFNQCEIANNISLEDEILRADIVVFGFSPINNCSVDALKRIEDLGKSVFYAGVKQFGYNYGWLKLKKIKTNDISLECTPRLHVEVQQNEEIAAVFDAEKIIDLQSLITCDDSKGVIVTDNVGRLLSVDRTHLTYPGAVYLSEKLMESNISFLKKIKSHLLVD